MPRRAGPRRLPRRTPGEDNGYELRHPDAERRASGEERGQLPCALLTVLRVMDEAVARRMLAGVGAEIDTMNAEQKDRMRA